MPDPVVPVVADPSAPLPVVAVPVAGPSTAQVVSAALQNIVVAAILGAAWLLGKLDTTVAVVALLLVVGIDFAGRKRLPSSTTAVAAMGATGVLHVLGFGGVLASALLALVGGCAAPAFDMTPVKSAVAATEDVYVALCTDPEVAALPKVAEACAKAYPVVVKAVSVYNTADRIAAELAAEDAGK